MSDEAFVGISFTTSDEAYIDFRLAATAADVPQHRQLKAIFEEWHNDRAANGTALQLTDEQYLPIPRKMKYPDRRKIKYSSNFNTRQTIRSLLKNTIKDPL